MPSAPELTTVIKAVNEASGPMRQVTESLAGMRGEAVRAGHAVAHMEHAGTFARMREHIAGVRERLVEMRAHLGEGFHALAELAPALGALGGAGSLVGLVELTNQTSELYSGLSKTATQLGVTVPQLRELDMAAKMTDVSTEGMHTGLMRLNRTIGDVVGGKGKEAAALFSQLHISLTDEHGHLRSAADLLPQIADAFQHAADPAMRARMAMVLMGRGGREMIPLLAEGSEGLREFAEASKQVDFQPTKKQREELEQYHRSMILFTGAIGGLKDEIGTALAPVLTPILDTMRKWIVANRDWIATGITRHLRELRDAFNGFDADHPIRSLRDMFDELTGTKDGWEKMIGVMGGFGLLAASPFIAAAGTVIKDLMKLAAWSGTAALAIGTTLVNALKAATAAMGDFDKRFRMTAIGKTAAIALAVYDLAQHTPEEKFNDAQRKLVEGWHHKPGQTFTTEQREQLEALGTPKAPPAGFFARPINDSVHDWLNGLGFTGAPAPKGPNGAPAAWPAWNMPAPSTLPGGAADAPRPALPIRPPPSAETGQSWWQWLTAPIGGGPAAAPRPVPPSPLSFGGGAGGGGPGMREAAVNGKVDVTVNLPNLPPGTTVNAKGSGAADRPVVNLGYNSMLGMSP